MKIILFLFILLSLNSFAQTESNKFDVTIQAGLDYRMSPTQLAVMYRFNPSHQLGLKAGVDREGDERQTSFALQSKHFFREILYIAPEIFYLNTREKESWWFTDVIFNQKATYAEYVSMGAGIRIGSQWTIKHFNLGFDWFGVGRRIGTFRKDYNNSEETTYTLLNVYAGLSF